MTSILVATDGSEGADRAIDYASQRAKVESAELVIVNIVGGYDLPEGAMRALTRTQHAWLDESLTAVSAETLVKARERARSAGADVVKLESRSGNVAQSIIEIAEEHKADAIVVGKRGAGRISQLLLGSVSQKVVSLAPVPVIVVP